MGDVKAFALRYQATNMVKAVPRFCESLQRDVFVKVLAQNDVDRLVDGAKPCSKRDYKVSVVTHAVQLEDTSEPDPNPRLLLDEIALQELFNLVTEVNPILHPTRVTLRKPLLRVVLRFCESLDRFVAFRDRPSNSRVQALQSIDDATDRSIKLDVLTAILAQDLGNEIGPIVLANELLGGIICDELRRLAHEVYQSIEGDGLTEEVERANYGRRTLGAEELELLFDLLAEKFGICIHPAEQQRMLEAQMEDPEVLSTEILRIEGFDSSDLDGKMAQSVLREVRRSFSTTDAGSTDD